MIQSNKYFAIGHKSYKSTLILTAILIMATAVLGTACTVTEVAMNTDEKDPLNSFAWEIINRDIETHESNPKVDIVDSKITRLEKVETFDKLADMTIHVYALEYRLLPKDLSKVVMAGGMDVDEDGWLKETSSMGSPLLVVSDNEGKLKFLGTLWTGGVIEDGGMEASIKAMLECNE